MKLLEKLAYNKYCKLNKLNPGNGGSAKMYYFYKEAEAASTDCNIEKDDMIEVTTNWAYASTSTATPNYFSLAPISPQECMATPYPVPCAKAKGNNPMYVDNDKHIESSKINYLTNRAENICFDKEREINKTFGLVDDEAPQTPAGLVKRIQDGKFVVKAEYADKTFYDPARYISWRDPAVKADQEGAKAATKVLRKLLTDTQDQISIGTPAEGLAAVKALDAWTPTVN